MMNRRQWLGITAGVTPEGIGFIAARFESAEAARTNSDRPEQSAWWADTEKIFTDDVSFVDCDDIGMIRGGGSDDAGFLQVIRGRVNDVEAARALLMDDMPGDLRPDVIGGMVGMMPDGSYTMVVYFTSEAEARVGEEATAGDEYDVQMDELHDEPPRYLDLTDPWLMSP
jgi:hypothetical protein